VGAYSNPEIPVFEGLGGGTNSVTEFSRRSWASRAGARWVLVEIGQVAGERVQADCVNVCADRVGIVARVHDESRVALGHRLHRQLGGISASSTAGSCSRCGRTRRSRTRPSRPASRTTNRGE
jgi:hypothetical protein